jgi:hypothetical protein
MARDQPDPVECHKLARTVGTGRMPGIATGDPISRLAVELNLDARPPSRRAGVTGRLEIISYDQGRLTSECWGQQPVGE